MYIKFFLNAFQAVIVFCCIATSSLAGEFSIRQKMPLNVDAGAEFTIETLIRKKSINSFGKFTQELPSGFTASSEQIKGGTFSFSDNTVKIIWIALPVDTEFIFTYKVKVDPSVTGIQTVNGKFNYVDGIEKRTADLSAKMIHIKSSLTAKLSQSISPGAETKNTARMEEGPIAAASVSAPAPAAKTPAAGTASLTASAGVPVTEVKASAPALDKSNENAEQVVYKVQLGVFSKKVASSHFAGIKEVSSMEENGMFKYFSGVFNTMEEAQKRKEEVLNKGHKGAYVVKHKKM